MSRLVFVSLIILVTSVKSKSFLGIATSENGKSPSLDSSADVDLSSEIDDLKNPEEDKFADFQRVKFFDSSPQYTAEKLEENAESGQNEEDPNDLKIDLINSNSPQNSPSIKRMTTDKEIMDYLSALYRTGYGSYRDYEEPELIWPLMRREINNLRGFHDFIEPESVPWSFEFHNRHEGDSYRQNYFQKNSYPKNFNPIKNDSFLSSYQNPNGYQKSKELQYGSLLPQYIQKKNYNNFYVIIPGGKQVSGCSTEESANSDNKSRGNLSGRKLIRKNDWNQYLEFLKFAFQKLDEEPYYYYYYDESDQDDYGSTDPVKIVAQPPLQTYLLGPTLYVDNSGKISQSNFHGTSFQNIGGVSANPKFTSVAPSHFKLGEEEDWKSSFQNRNRNLFEQTTMDHSSAAPTEPYNSTEINATEPTRQSDINFRFGPYSPDILRRFGDDNLRTTVASITEETHSLKNPYTTNYPPEESTTERKDDLSLFSIFTGNTDSTYHPFPYWFTIADFQTVQPSVPPPTSTWMLRKESEAIEAKNKEDVDCNDKMLPCPDTVNVTYPLNGYCNRYVTCESGRAIRRLCSDGLHYNPITKSCDLPHNSICTYACPKPNGIYGIPGDCGGYFVCKNSVLEYRMCPPKMHWDTRREKCVFEELSSCPMKCDDETKIKSYDGDCKGYIICLQDIPYYHKCPPNMKFDQVSQSCIPEHLSHCKDDPKLLVKTLNPNVLCNNIMKKFGTKSWCDYFSANKITTTLDIE